jgi:peptide/nickel transport system permease protein
MMGVTLVIGIGFVFVNMIIDLLYGYVDPRVRLRAK